MRRRGEGEGALCAERGLSDAVVGAGQEGRGLDTSHQLPYKEAEAR